LELKKKAEAKNNLEALIYKARDLLESEDFIEYCKEVELETLTELVSEFSEWMYGDEVETAKREEFLKMTNRLNAAMKHINYRIENAEGLG